MKATYSIIDRHGVPYRLDFVLERQLWSVSVGSNQRSVAFAHCVDAPPILRINELWVRKEMPDLETRWDRFVRRVKRRREPMVSLRGNGVGTAMLDFIIGQAKSRGLGRIEGDVYAKDVEANAGVLDWCRHRGFTVMMHSDQTVRVATVVRVL